MNGENEQARVSDIDFSDPEMSVSSSYRLGIYRFAQARLRDELTVGTPRAIAVWTAGRAAGEHFDLEPAAWALLVHALLVSVAD